MYSGKTPKTTVAYASTSVSKLNFQLYATGMNEDKAQSLCCAGAHNPDDDVITQYAHIAPDANDIIHSVKEIV